MALIGGGEISPEALTLMRERAQVSPSWAAYQNHDLGSREIGALQFLLVGPTRTYKEAPERLPDTPDKINWRYWKVGHVDLQAGKVVPDAKG
jgi:hypothetical protein